MKNMKWMVLLMVLGALACQREPVDSEMLEGTSWRLHAMQVNGTMLHLPADLLITLDFGQDQCLGYGGCNAYGSNYLSPAPQQLQITELFSTEKYCIISYDWERQYLGRLASCQSFVLTPQTLVLDCGAQGILHFVAQ